MMAKKLYGYAAALFLMTGIAVLTGCDSQGGDDVHTKQESQETSSSTEEASDEEVTEQIDIYTINESTLSLEDSTAMVTYRGQLDVKTVVDAVVESFSEHGVEIGIDHTDMEEDAAIVSFTEESEGKAPLCNAGSGVESAILDGISQSILDNVPDCKEVIFRIKDEDYESGVFAFDYDQAYKWK